MYDYKILEDTGIEVLHQAFVDAFSDYQVKINLPFWKFQQMLQRRGYVPGISMGAFKDGELVGFILNGFRDWNGKKTIYDVGTGVIQGHRRQGVTSNMFRCIRELLKQKKVEQYLLEVIQSNISAVNLYSSQGFKITRSFQCFQLDKVKYDMPEDYKVEHIDRISPADWKNFVTFWDIKPSWQNSIDSVDSAYDAFIYSVVRIDGEIAGYGIIDRRTGDIPQIAVNMSYRMNGIAQSIISDLIKNTESQMIAVLNIDSESKDVIDCLTKLGFQNYVSQYEMVLDLDMSEKR